MKLEEAILKRITFVVIGLSGTVAVVALGNYIGSCMLEESAKVKKYELGKKHDLTVSQFVILKNAIKKYAVDHAALSPSGDYFGPFPYTNLTTPISYLNAVYLEELGLDVGSKTPFPTDAFGPSMRSAPGYIKRQRNVRVKGSDFMYAAYSNNIYAIISRGPDGVFQFDPDVIRALKSDDKRTSYILSISMKRDGPLTKSTRGDFVSWGYFSDIKNHKTR